MSCYVNRSVSNDFPLILVFQCQKMLAILKSRCYLVDKRRCRFITGLLSESEG